MNTNIIIGNILGLIASTLMVFGGLIKGKKLTVVVQSLQTLLFIIGDIFLLAYAGAVSDTVLLIMFLLVLYKKMKTVYIPILFIIMLISAIFMNTHGWVDYIPVFIAFIYLCICRTENMIIYKSIYGVTAAIWVFYEIMISAYTASIFSTIYIFTNLITVYRLVKEKKINKMQS